MQELVGLLDGPPVLDSVSEQAVLLDGPLVPDALLEQAVLLDEPLVLDALPEQAEVPCELAAPDAAELWVSVLALLLDGTLDAVLQALVDEWPGPELARGFAERAQQGDARPELGRWWEEGGMQPAPLVWRHLRVLQIARDLSTPRARAEPGQVQEACGRHEPRPTPEA
jgi:hypothetical protein